jgi:hypothetical protein
MLPAMKKTTLPILLLFASFLILGPTNAQEAYKIGLVGFYNLENLFDTINDPSITDGEFTPEGANQWNTEKYNAKLHNMAYAISTIGLDYTPDGLAVL